MRKAGIILLGSITLIAAGTAMGILFAPEKGARTRKKIVRRSRRLFNSISDTIEEGRSNIDEIRERLKDKLEDLNEMVDQFPARCSTAKKEE
ncbi:MAG: YtxH domain-containing protein [Taibaiella sp.]|jgi:gas vesicle protein